MVGGLGSVLFRGGKKSLKDGKGRLRSSKTVLNDKEVVISFTVYVRREGRITVPKELRDAYRIEEGDLVECWIKKIK